MSGSHVRSWYAASAPDFPAQPALEGVLQADVCILGAGITGLSTAIELAEAAVLILSSGIGRVVAESTEETTSDRP